MDYIAVKTADRPALVSFAAAAAENAGELLEDAEFLFGAGRHARAYSLAVLAVEEFGKASGVLTLALMPDDLRSRMDTKSLRMMLETHLLKQLGGLLPAAVDFGTPGMAARLAAAPAGYLAEILTDAAARAQESDRTKLRGLYVDIAGDGSVQRPADVTEGEAQEQIEIARNVVAGPAALLTDPEAVALFSDLPPDTLALSSALFGGYFDGYKADSAEAAAEAVLSAVNRVRDHMGGLPGEV